MIGFNSDSYDFGLAKSYWFKYSLPHKPKCTQKRQHSCAHHFKFLDISLYLALEFFILYFGSFRQSEDPYDCLTNPNILAEMSLPPHTGFFSAFENKNISG